MLHDLTISTSNEFTGIEHHQIKFRIDGEAADRILAELPDTRLAKRLNEQLGDVEVLMGWEAADEACFEYLIDGCDTYVEHCADGLHFSMLVPVDHEDRQLDGTADEYPLSELFWIRPSRIVRALLAH